VGEAIDAVFGRGGYQLAVWLCYAAVGFAQGYLTQAIFPRSDRSGSRFVWTYDNYGRVMMIQHYPVSTGSEDVCRRVALYYDKNPFSGSYSQYTLGRKTTVEYQGAGCGYITPITFTTVTRTLSSRCTTTASGPSRGQRTAGLVINMAGAQYLSLRRMLCSKRLDLLSHGECQGNAGYRCRLN
jgi:hypothetical protein